MNSGIAAREIGGVFRTAPARQKYHDAMKAYEPYDKLIRPLPDMRDQTVKLVKQAIGEGRRAYVLVNNLSEWNASLRVQSLAERF